MLRRTTVHNYRYREFEFTKAAEILFYYAREAPNTSYFPQWHSMHHMGWGWGKEELWMDKEQRRYESTWQMWRKMFMALVPLFYVFPYGLPSTFIQWRYSDTGKNPFLKSCLPFDQMYIEQGGCTLAAEWQRHIHSKESY